nr:MAG TPA: hypothetical protein [Caudoviricetes sp.]
MVVNVVKELSVFGVLFIFLSLIILRETNPNLITVLNTLLSGVCALIGSIIGGNYALKAVEKSWQLSSGAESENKLKNLIIRLKLSISALDSVKDGKCSMIDACIPDHEILNEAIIAKLEKKEIEAIGEYYLYLRKVKIEFDGAHDYAEKKITPFNTISLNLAQKNIIKSNLQIHQGFNKLLFSIRDIIRKYDSD